MATILRIDFRTQYYCACELHDKTAPEPVPHPDRLTSALRAGAAVAGLDPAPIAALVAGGPPSITVDPAILDCESTVGAAYVPPIAKGKKRSARHFPDTRHEEPLYYHYPATIDAETLGKIAAAVPYLGSARSPVSISVVDAAPAPTLVPGKPGALYLRVSPPGRIEELDVAFAAGLSPRPPHPIAYHWTGEAVIGGEFDEAAFWRFAPGEGIPARYTLPVMDAWRALVLKELGDNAPAAFHGHGELSSRISYIPAIHRDRIIGVGLAGDIEMPAQAAEIGQTLVLRWSNRNVDLIRDPADRRATLSADYWSRPSRCWATVTPAAIKFGRSLDAVVKHFSL
jgi:CRISPR-associated protein Csb2